jgi:hypothetical protein
MPNPSISRLIALAASITLVLGVHLALVERAALMLA